MTFRITDNLSVSVFKYILFNSQSNNETEMNLYDSELWKKNTV